MFVSTDIVILNIIIKNWNTCFNNL